jgi:hypothetical protein
LGFAHRLANCLQRHFLGYEFVGALR